MRNFRVSVIINYKNEVFRVMIGGRALKLLLFMRHLRLLKLLSNCY